MLARINLSKVSQHALSYTSVTRRLLRNGWGAEMVVSVKNNPNCINAFCRIAALQTTTRDLTIKRSQKTLQTKLCGALCFPLKVSNLKFG